MAVKTVGVDLSLTATGIARSDGACTLIGRTGITNLSIADQIGLLNGLADEIVGTACGIRHPTVAVIEGLDMAQSYGGQIERTVLWWKVVEEFVRHEVQVFVAPSAQVKMYATGKGSGPKGAVIEAITRLWPQFQHRGNDNLADASSCALIAAHLLGQPIAHPDAFDPVTYLPASHLRALQSVRAITAPPPPKKGHRKTI